MSAPASREFIFKSRRATSAGSVAGPQAPADRAAGVVGAVPAEPFRPFRAYVLAWPAHRPKGAMHLVPSTLSVKRSDVRGEFIGFYRDRETGNRQWARALKDGARIMRVIVSADPSFDPQGVAK
jgi:hypothetical protein